jgi:hypothetical protein
MFNSFMMGFVVTLWLFFKKTNKTMFWFTLLYLHPQQKYIMNLHAYP